MAQLGGTHNPKDLVPGDPAQVRTTAATMTRFATALILAGDGLKKIDDGGWTGPAAKKFHDEFDSEPARWTKCGDAFDDAAQALTSYASTLEWAQGQAKEAIALWDEAETATKQATAEYEAKVRKAALDPLNYGGMPIPFHDPGEAKRKAAEDKLTRAQHQLDEAGDKAETIVGHARDKAPPKPKWWQKALHLAKEFYKGEWEATLGLLKFAWDTSTIRMIVDPVGYAHTVQDNLHAATYAAQHPLEFGKTIIDYDTWKTSPARALGHLAPDAAIAIATAGAGTEASAGARILEKTAETGSKWAPRSELRTRLAEIANRNSNIQLSAERRVHILDGDPGGGSGGGHRHGTGKPGKTEFPANWSDQQTIDNITSVAQNPDIAITDRGGDTVMFGTRDGVRIKVVLYPDGSICTAYPPVQPGIVANPR